MLEGSLTFWPDGKETNRQSVQVNQLLVLKQVP